MSTENGCGRRLAGGTRWRWGRARLLALLGILGTACEDAPITSTPIRHVDDVRSFVGGVLKDGPLLVVVRGEPFVAPAEDIENAVVTAVRSAMGWTASPQLTLDPSAAARPTFRVIAIFNDAPARPCVQPSVGGPPSANGRLALTLAFCAGADALSQVEGRLKHADGPGDPRFLALIRQATVDLFEDKRDN